MCEIESDTIYQLKLTLKQMVDWNGLFKWSMEHQDGTKPSDFKAMSEEDRKWLEAALK